MPTDRGREHTGTGVDDAVRTLILLMPRLVGRAKRAKIPAELQSFQLAPRHLSLLAHLLLDGPLSVSELATHLEVTPATVSLMVSDLSRQGIVERREDDSDRRRTIVSVAEPHRPAIDTWLSVGAKAWRKALEPLTPADRHVVVTTLQAYEQELAKTDF